MTEYQTVDATMAHAEELAPYLCEADTAEVWAANHLTPIDALRLSVLQSREMITGIADGRVVLMAGVATRSFLGDQTRGVTWMLGAEELPQHSKHFLRGSRRFIEIVRPRYSILENWVDKRHHRAIKWLRWLGFEIEEAVPFGIDRMPFHYFSMQRSDDV
jgi:hypothetical protein